MSYQELEKVFKKIARDLILISAVMIVTGLICVIFPEHSSMAICYVIGAALCVWGVLRTVVYFAADRGAPFTSFSFVQGVALLIAGVVVLLRPEFLRSFLIYLFGIMLIADGVLKLQYSMDLLRLRAHGWWIVFILTIVSVTAGIIALLNPFATVTVLMVYSGICLIVDGLFDVYALFYIHRVTRKLKQREEAAQIPPAHFEN